MCRDENLQVEIIILFPKHTCPFPINLLNRGVYFPPAVADFKELLAFPYEREVIVDHSSSGS